MTSTFTQVPPDSTGDKLAMRSYTRGSDVLHSQGVYYDALPTFRVLAPAIVPATNKYHIYVGNNSASGQTLWLTGLYAINDNVTGVTGVINQFNFRRVTGTPTGITSLTPYAFNSADTALANVTAGHTPTSGLTDSTVILPLVLSSEENTAVPTNTGMFLHHMNLLPPPSPYQRPMALRPGEAAAVKQIGGGTVGALSWIIDFSVEPD